jgi:hypothetical protein
MVLTGEQRCLIVDDFNVSPTTKPSLQLWKGSFPAAIRSADPAGTNSWITGSVVIFALEKMHPSLRPLPGPMIPRGRSRSGRCRSEICFFVHNFFSDK